MEMGGQLTPRLLHLWERTPVLIEQDARWVPEPIWTFRRRENLLYLPGFEPRIVRLAAQSQYRLRNSISGRLGESNQKLTGKNSVTIRLEQQMYRRSCTMQMTSRSSFQISTGTCTWKLPRTQRLHDTYKDYLTLNVHCHHLLLILQFWHPLSP